MSSGGQNSWHLLETGAEKSGKTGATQTVRPRAITPTSDWQGAVAEVKKIKRRHREITSNSCRNEKPVTRRGCNDGPQLGFVLLTVGVKE